MRKVLGGCLLAAALLLNTSALGIDGKLDFGNRHSESASFRSHNTNHKNTFVPETAKVSTETKEDFDKIGVVCVSGGCNTTKTTSAGNSVQTDVVVHIHTKVDLSEKDKENKSVIADDTPDVPVVVGYKGSKLDATIDEEGDSHSQGPPSIYVPDLEPVNIRPTSSPSVNPSLNTYFSSYGSSVRPSVSSRVDSSSSTFNRHYPSVYERNPSGSVPISPPIITSRVDSSSHKFDKHNPSFGNSHFYVDNTDSNVNINLEPSIGISSSRDRGNIDAKTNTVGVHVPYFNPAFHNHYFGENPPPQVVWYPKKGTFNNFNPVEFKTVKSTWTPSIWKKTSPHRHATSTVGSGVECTCKEGQTPITGRWYPGSSLGSFNDPGSQINDKLAPLNK